MNYHLQERDVSTGLWERLPKSFDCPLDALEARDKLFRDCPNNGIPYNFRAVDESGDVLEYGQRDV